MPPRKRARASTASTPLGETQAKTPVETSQPASDDKVKDVDEAMEDASAVVDDPWTDDQETQLLRGLMKWKPAGKLQCLAISLNVIQSSRIDQQLTYAGVNKHFNMLCIASQFLEPHHPANSPSGHSSYPQKPSAALTAAPHTRIPGIWAKLGTLYNLDALDEREDARLFPELDITSFANPEDEDEHSDDEDEDEDEEMGGVESNVLTLGTGRKWTEFKLEDADDGETRSMMWERRFESDAAAAGSQTSGSRRGGRNRARSESPPVLGWDVQKTMPTTFSMTTRDGTESDSPAGRSGAHKSRAGNTARSRRGTRGVKEEAEEDDEGEEESGDEEEEGSDEEDGDEDEENDEEEEDEEEETGSSPAAKGSNSAKRARSGPSKPAIGTRKSSRKR